MPFLDALAAGVETIVTRQGFHLDIEDGITHGFLTGPELIEIFRELGQRRARLVNAGAAAASGSVLLFLHADTELPGSAMEAVADAMLRLTANTA